MSTCKRLQGHIPTQASCVRAEQISIFWITLNYSLLVCPLNKIKLTVVLPTFSAPFDQPWTLWGHHTRSWSVAWISSAVCVCGWPPPPCFFFPSSPSSMRPTFHLKFCRSSIHANPVSWFTVLVKWEFMGFNCEGKTYALLLVHTPLFINVPPLISYLWTCSWKHKETHFRWLNIMLIKMV